VCGKIREAMIALDGKWPTVKNKPQGEYLHRLSNGVYTATKSCANKSTLICSYSDWMCSPPYHRQQQQRDGEFTPEQLHTGNSPQEPAGFIQRAVDELVNNSVKVIKDGFAQPVNKYHRQIIGLDGQRVTVDVYRVLHAFATGLPEIDHAVKKLLAPGTRGAKDKITDLREAAQSIECAIKYLEQSDAVARN